MNYNYENLNDESFQELCHSIINTEFPDSQAFPVGQPDGGRDTIVYELNSNNKPYFIFQVKFVRNPEMIDDVLKWFIGIMKKELPKINRLKPKGATKFYLLTNVRGSAHLDVGAIDLLNKELERTLDIPSICWWRDDLNGKLDNNVNLRWSYPQLINGQDLFNSVMFAKFNESNTRNQSIIKSYLADQYQIENEVKFKQIELENSLFDLFVDVPLMVKEFSQSNLKRNTHVFNEIIHKFKQLPTTRVEVNESTIGAAYFLLNSITQKKISKILLEGGPGQGKSTITQFICQVHRAKLLNKHDDLDAISTDYKNNALRLPFKIDLRDLASWISGKNPYSININEQWFSSNYKNSLESFLIAHIYYHSNIDKFSITDLFNVCVNTPILIVFDGFDEIADIEIRENIVSTINTGIKRLSENISHIQVIITSRPAAFANSTKFSTDQYPHFQLTEITNSVITDYLEKWIVGKKLKQREGNDMRRIVQNKLELPHLRDLAKSPMQLAILLSLINTRGESLPNKRTELYDSYIDLFFNRESEKNEVVRNRRDLLINIHRYLAWVLHSEAELYNNNGRIELHALKDKLKEYLDKEGHSTDIADQLFTVMEERVCAIVSRVLGTFEFEVQPLREYFCAKFLYDTSPYAPAGSHKTGTLPDRFDALVRNFYWQNVLRFFAGCFDRGELPLLIDKLKEVNHSELLKHTNYIRSVTAELLSDFVFSDYPKLLKDVIKVITSGIDIGSILNVKNNFGTESLTLPIDCGRKELNEECFSALSKFPTSDYADELLTIIGDNDIDNTTKWIDLSKNYTGDQLDKWLSYGRQMQILHNVEDVILKEIITKDGEVTNYRLRILLESNKWNLIDANQNWKSKSLENVLNGKIAFTDYQNRNLPFFGLIVLFNPYILKSMLGGHFTNHSLTFANHINRRMFGRRSVNNQEFSNVIKLRSVNDEIDKAIEAFYKSVSALFPSNVDNWINSLDLWSILIDNGVEIFGDQWLFKVTAVMGAGIKSLEETYLEINSLHDNAYPLSQRTRSARLRSGQVAWWKNELDSSPDPTFSLLILLTWGTAKTLIELAEEIDIKLKKLDREDYSQLQNGLKKTADLSHFNVLQQKQITTFFQEKKSSDNFLYLISLRFPDSTRNKYIKTFFHDYAGDSRTINCVILDYAIMKFLDSESVDSLEKIRKLYVKLADYRFNLYRFYDRKHLSYENAKVIMEDCKSYPKILVGMAESSARSIANKKAIAIGKIARNEKWFDE
jgi:hypothetical protein